MTALELIKRLRNNADKLGGRDRDFADSLLGSLDRGHGLSVKQMVWVDRLGARATATAPVATNVGSIVKIVELLATAKQHLKYPAIVMQDGNTALRVSIAGAMAKCPGSITVTSTNKDAPDGRRTWFGRVTKEGAFEPSDRIENATAIAAVLAAFAANPADAASQYGRLHGNCCFCNKSLDDARSTAVGYGKTCAKHYGLTWGVAKTTFKAKAEAAI